MKKYINGVIEGIRKQNAAKIKQMEAIREIEAKNKKAQADEIRIKSALEVMKLNYEGDMSKCDKTRDFTQIEDYCLSSF